MLDETKYIEIWRSNAQLAQTSFTTYRSELRKLETYMVLQGVTDWDTLDFDRFYEDDSVRLFPIDSRFLRRFDEWLRTETSEFSYGSCWKAVHSFFRTLHQCGVIQTDPTLRLHVKIPALPGRTSVLSDDELTRLVKAALLMDQKTKRIQCVLLLLHAGLRNTELRLLVREDLDFEQGIINLTRGTKGGHARIVPMTEKLISSLQYYIERAEVGPGCVLFSINGRPMSCTTLGNLIKRVAKSAGIEKNVFPHLFRHTGLTNLYRSGAPASDIQAIAGHAFPRTMETYIHPHPDEQRKILEESVMNEVLTNVFRTRLKYRGT